MAKKNQWSEEDDALLADLGIELAPQHTARYTPREERIIAGFEEIERFYVQHGCLPRSGNHQESDIFERLYAVRLEALRQSPECLALLAAQDAHGLLTQHTTPKMNDLDDDALLDALGVHPIQENDITVLQHVKPRAQIRAEAEQIARRQSCPDFALFKPLFNQVQQELKAGIRVTTPYHKDARIHQGEYYILGGQKAYVAEVGEWFEASYGNKDARLRVIFDNGTESHLLFRSFQKALNADKQSRRLSDSDAGPLFADTREDDDTQVGTIYVLRSLSAHPEIQARQTLIHKIGVTGGQVETRIANAKNEATFLLAEVEVVATYELYNINRHKLERLLHQFFAAAQLSIEILDRFGKPIKPHEWFLVPLFAIDEAVEKIKIKTLPNYCYDPTQAKLVLL